MTFQDLNLVEPLRRALEAEGYTVPTPIQAQAIPHVLAGRDLLACAQTGTGKTAAFALPILQRLAARRRAAPEGDPRARSSRPTRELAAQIAESLATYGQHLRLRHAVVFGGVGRATAGPRARGAARHPRRDAGPPARPRVSRGSSASTRSKCFVLDEADRMLDMGFLRDVKRDPRAPPAEAPDAPLLGDDAARHRGARRSASCADPVRVAVTPVSTTAERIEQSVYFVARRKARRCSSTCSRTGDRRGRSSSRARSTAPTRSSRARARQHLRRGHPRQQVAERPRRARSSRSATAHPRPRRDRHRGARNRRRRHLARHQLRPARRRRELRAPHRPHRARRRERNRALVLRQRRAGAPAGIERLIRMRIPVAASPAGVASGHWPPSRGRGRRRAACLFRAAARVQYALGAVVARQGRRRGGPSRYRGNRI